MPHCVLLIEVWLAKISFLNLISIQIYWENYNLWGFGPTSLRSGNYWESWKAKILSVLSLELKFEKKEHTFLSSAENVPVLLLSNSSSAKLDASDMTGSPSTCCTYSWSSISSYRFEKRQKNNSLSTFNCVSKASSCYSSWRQWHLFDLRQNKPHNRSQMHQYSKHKMSRFLDSHKPKVFIRLH